MTTKSKAAAKREDKREDALNVAEPIENAKPDEKALEELKDLVKDVVYCEPIGNAKPYTDAGAEKADDAAETDLWEAESSGAFRPGADKVGKSKAPGVDAAEKASADAKYAKEEGRTDSQEEPAPTRSTDTTAEGKDPADAKRKADLPGKTAKGE